MSVTNENIENETRVQQAFDELENILEILGLATIIELQDLELDAEHNYLARRIKMCLDNLEYYSEKNE